MNPTWTTGWVFLLFNFWFYCVANFYMDQPSYRLKDFAYALICVNFAMWLLNIISCIYNIKRQYIHNYDSVLSHFSESSITPKKKNKKRSSASTDINMQDKPAETDPPQPKKLKSDSETGTGTDTAVESDTGARAKTLDGENAPKTNQKRKRKSSQTKVCPDNNLCNSLFLSQWPY